MEEIYLAGGQQVWRDSVRVEAYGDVDELNSTIGVVRAFNAELVGIHPAADRLEEELRWMQNKLFDVGGLLATAPGQTFKNMPTVTARDVTRLEKLMDRCQKDLPPLKEFILPGAGRFPACYTRPERSVDGLNVSVCDWGGKSLWIRLSCVF